MASLTLRNVPERVLARLRRRAEADARPLDEAAVRLLDAALADEPLGFGASYATWRESLGAVPLGDEAVDAAFGDVRSREAGRPDPFGPDGQ